MPSEPHTSQGHSGSSGFSAIPDPANLREEDSQTVNRAKAIDTVLTSLAHCTFPATPDEIAACVGDNAVKLGHEEIPFREVLRVLPSQPYENAKEVKEHLVEHWSRLNDL